MKKKAKKPERCSKRKCRGDATRSLFNTGRERREQQHKERMRKGERKKRKGKATKNS